MKDFLASFTIEGAMLRVGVGGVKDSHMRYYASVPDDLALNREVYFGPAQVSPRSQTMHESSVMATRALWVDIDDSDVMPKSVLPPSYVVRSGHGWHFYWLLDELIEDINLIKYLNKGLAVPLGGDDCFNANRVLRIPGSLNLKDPAKPVRVELKVNRPTLKYSPQVIQAATALDPSNVIRITTGDQRTFKSRSERDFAVMRDLIKCGVPLDTIKLIFQHHEIGDKYRKEGEAYLTHTYERALSGTDPKQVGAKKSISTDGIEKREDGYYKGVRRLSTFTFEPMLLLDATGFEAADAIVGTVRSSGFEWPNVTFSREAFTKMQAFDRECPMAAWQWLGHEGDLRALLPLLMDELRAKGLPHTLATPTMGLHMVKDKPFFVGDKQTLGTDEIWEKHSGPISWLPSKREHPKLDLSIGTPTDRDLELLRELLPLTNHEEVFWPMLGWYAACAYKPWLQNRQRRFPTLNVTGTKGSGKTTMIQKLMQPLFGYDAASSTSYDAGTTKFVTLMLMGSTNGVPVSFSEFRYDAVQQFLRFVLLAYDTGNDPRGRADQTTVNHKLDAPFSIDGEDLITDPAAQERIVVIRMMPKEVAEGTEAFKAWEIVRNNLPKNFAGYYLQHVLRMIDRGQAEDLLKSAIKAVHAAFPRQMPDRVRNNHIVAYFGILSWCTLLNIEPPSALVMGRSIRCVCDLDTGRSRTQCDEFAEEIVGEVARMKSNWFQWRYDDAHRTLYVHMSSSHKWWLQQRRKVGKGGLELPAIKNQLLESDYYGGTMISDGAVLYGIKLEPAKQSGLDVVTDIKLNTLEVQY